MKSKSRCKEKLWSHYTKISTVVPARVDITSAMHSSCYSWVMFYTFTFHISCKFLFLVLLWDPLESHTYLEDYFIIWKTMEPMKWCCRIFLFTERCSQEDCSLKKECKVRKIVALKWIIVISGWLNKEFLSSVLVICLFLFLYNE